MLSAETASGRYPIESVKIMNQIAEETERHFQYDAWLTNRHIGDYIAGMTDRFAIDRYADIFGRDAVPKALAHA